MDYQFKGYKRKDGRAGIRNHIGVICSVVCSSVVVKEIAESVPGTIAFTHGNGCAQLGDDFKLTKNMVAGISANPNLYSTLLVGLGCETNQISGLLESIPKVKPIEGIGIQQLAGGVNTIQKGVEITEQWAKEAAEQQRESLPLSCLNVGILTVDMDKDSYCQVAPVIGGVVDRLVEHGATVMMGLSQTLEPAGSALSERAVSEELKNNLQLIGESLQRKRWKDVHNDSLTQLGFTEKERELAVLEAEMTGTSLINSLLGYSETPTEKGLHLITVPSNIVEALSNMASSGCNLAIVVSSRGILAGSAAIPCMTIAPENQNEFFDELIDYKVTTESLSNQIEALLENIIEICSGKQTSLEKMELGEFSIPHVGTTF
ncbi:UxaA family hydrolase [Bacillus sp. FJAT-29953]|nr:UxaA family hydrolase [Bacillus sp. FJAT-29953]